MAANRCRASLGREVAPGTYRIDNSPWYVYGISNGDTVTAHAHDGELVFDAVVERSGHSTFRVIVRDPDDVQAVRDEFRALCCPSELSDIPRLIAIDVPPGVHLGDLQMVLEGGKASDRWDYEEAHVPDEYLPDPE